MKTYFPHYFKRIGILFTAIVLSFTANVDDIRWGFGAGYNHVDASVQGAELDRMMNYTPSFTKEEHQPWLNASLILSIAGFILYLFSKEKAEDEFYQQLRFKCLTQALLVTWLFTGFVYALLPEYQLDGFYILQLHLVFYTILYVYNKNWKFMA
ncbi:MAG: hypothetical protein ACEPOZ_10890 [Marinifilaceae bacterium]